MKNQNPSSNRLKTLLSLGIGGLALIGAASLGIDDNPPGLLLAYLAVFCFILAFAHTWRSKRQFGMLAVASILGFVFFAFLHNLLDAAASELAARGLMKSVLEEVSGAAFFLAVLISPAAFVVGAVGWIIFFIRIQSKPS